MKAVRNMVNSFAELKVCAETVELLNKWVLKSLMPVQEQAIPGIICRPWCYSKSADRYW